MTGRNPLRLNLPTQNTPRPLRACMECYRRKLKCNRNQPCSSCVRGGVACLYTNEPIRRDRKSKHRDLKLAGRVADLERLLGSHDDQRAERNLSARTGDSADDESKHFQQHPGRLLVHGPGKSLFVTKTFWAELPAKVAESNNSLGYDSAYQLDPVPQQSLPYGSFFFPYATPRTQTAAANPHLGQILRLWKIYIQNVDPLIRVLHKPTIEQSINDLSLWEGNIGSETRALLLAICYGAASSLTPSQARAEFAFDVQSYTASYRTATEKALIDAQVLQTHDLRVLQAFVIYLTCIPRNEARNIGILVSLAVRISRTMGLHREGSIFNLSPFETEMRRRIWWHLCLLDWRISEDIGLEAAITLSSFDTRMPLNINDEDMEIASPALHERRDYTEMAFSLVRYEAWKLAASCPCGKLVAFEETEAALKKLADYLDDTYWRPCRTISTPMSRLLLTMAPLVVAKLRLLMLYPACCSDIEKEVLLTPGEKDSLFRSCVSLLEFEQALGVDCELGCWRWFFFNTHIQWHAMSFVLSELCVRVQGVSEDAAWNVIDSVFKPTAQQMDRIDDDIWKPLYGLRQKALCARYSRDSELSTLFPPELNEALFDEFSIDWA
ncbi:hypothetical protein MKX08_002834 [Trichoderma sp. CBMAI-0020]|nr:hypothetical protein MKX08_002834 [Trichoderma sp. CBMAI-0020]